MRSIAPVAVLALAISACSSCSSNAGPTGGDGALASALRTVADTPATRSYVEFGRPADLVAANGGTSLNGAYARALDAGASALFGQAATVKRVLGFDIDSAHFAVGAGNPPHRGVLLSGLAPSPATATKLTALGATKTSSDGGAVYRFRPDNKVSTSDKLAKALPAVSSGMDALRIDGADVRFGASTSDVDTTRASAPGLLGYRPFADVAGCLGDPLAAVLTDRAPHPAAARGRTATTHSVGVQAIGAALSGAHGRLPTEQLCVDADSGQHASTIADAVRAAVRHGRSLTTNQSWSALLNNVSISVHGSTVELTAHPAQGKAGMLIESLITADLPGVSG